MINLIGRNNDALELISFCKQKTEVLNISIKRSDELERHIPVVNCVSSISPVDATNLLVSIGHRVL